jgi:hypothetical protein
MEEFSRIQRLPPYVFNITDGMKRSARHRGEDIIDFGMGNPDGPPVRAPKIRASLFAMKRTYRNIHDLHPKLFINAQILWIVFGTGLLYDWLPRLARSWKAGETYNLPLDIAYTVIGIVIVVAGFIVVNSTVSRLASKIPSDPEPRETERSPMFPTNAL